MKNFKKMPGTSYLFLFLLLSSCASGSLCRCKISKQDEAVKEQATTKLRNEILQNGQAYSNLKELVAGGSRLSGSRVAAQAVEWAKAKLESYGFDKVSLQEVMVPRWERGRIEKAVITEGSHHEQLKVAALGNSIGTSAKGVEAEVIEVVSLEDAQSKSALLKDKIVFFNGPMDPTSLDSFQAYGKAGAQRFRGPALAASFGAVAVLVRSMTMNHDLHPHTGATYFKDVKIPAATIATLDADKLSNLLKENSQNKKIRIKLNLSAQAFPDVKSYNVIGEMTGSQIPNEYVVVGGHLDSWDLGPGAQDDGAGVVQSIEVLRAMKALNLKPRRSVRVVLFMSEEFGGAGGVEYAKQAALKNEKHIAAVESDRGGFAPRGFETNGDEKVVQKLESWKKYLEPLKSDLILHGEGGTDIEPLRAAGTIQFGLYPDSSRYFDYHHAETDTMDAVNSRELHLGASAMATLIYLLANE